MTAALDPTSSATLAQSHIGNLGRLVEDMEAKMRNLLGEVYFSSASARPLSFVVERAHAGEQTLTKVELACTQRRATSSARSGASKGSTSAASTARSRASSSGCSTAASLSPPRSHLVSLCTLCLAVQSNLSYSCVCSSEREGARAAERVRNVRPLARLLVLLPSSEPRRTLRTFYSSLDELQRHRESERGEGKHCLIVVKRNERRSEVRGWPDKLVRRY